MLRRKNEPNRIYFVFRPLINVVDIKAHLSETCLDVVLHNIFIHLRHKTLAGPKVLKKDDNVPVNPSHISTRHAKIFMLN